MKPGELRHRVTLQSQVTTQDALGQPSTSWMDTATVWGDVRFQGGLEAIKSGADTSVVRASIRLRYRAVNAGQRVSFDGKLFNIMAVMNDPRKTYVDLVCETINAGS
jgi:SPP1 family predicted phage head-tail adaptor